MKKLLIPTILAATILIAASFALMPVQKATTTHLPSVTGANIAADSIGSAQIGTGAVGADELAANAVTAAGGELANDAVVSAKIADATVANADLAAAAIPNSITTTNAALTLTGAAQTVISGTITIARDANLLVLVSIPEVGSATDTDTLTLAIGTVTFSASGAAGTTAPTSLAYTNPISTTGTVTGVFRIPITGVTGSTIVTVPATLLDASTTKGTVALNTASIVIYALPS